VPRRVTGGVMAPRCRSRDRRRTASFGSSSTPARRESLDTSFIATDYLNNPGTMERRLQRAAAPQSCRRRRDEGGTLRSDWWKQLTGGAAQLGSGYRRPRSEVHVRLSGCDRALEGAPSMLSHADLLTVVDV